MDKWISVKDELPGLNEEVAMYFKSGEMERIEIGYCGKHRWVYLSKENTRKVTFIQKGAVTHWIRLPRTDGKKIAPNFKNIY